MSLHLIASNLIRLLTDRGYDTSQFQWVLQYTAAQFEEFLKTIGRQRNLPVDSSNPYIRRRTLRSLLSGVYMDSPGYVPPNGVPRQMHVFFATRAPTSKSITVDIVEEFLKHQGYSDAIFVADAALGHRAREALESLVGTRWQIFLDQELSYNVLDHVLVPRHVLLSKEDERRILTELHCEASQLPFINSSDPVIKYYGWLPGRIVMVERNDYFLQVLARRTIQYRIIIPG